MPVLLSPIWLAALAAIVLPFVIHLARRSEARPVDFAALRWLAPKPRPRRRPRLDELLLLALRLLLVALVALLLAEPVLTGAGDRRPVIAYAPGLSPRAVPENTRGVWLVPGFPALDETPSATAPLASLIRELDAALPAGAPLTLVVPAVLDGADAERPRLSRAVTWRIVPDATTPAARPTPLRFALRADGVHTGEARFIRAAALALTVPGFEAAPIDRPLPRLPAAVRLAAGPLPAASLDWARNGGRLLVGRDTVLPAGRAVVVWRDEAGSPLAEAQPLGRGRLVRFTRRLSAAAMPELVEPDFPRRLGALLRDPPAPSRVRAGDYRPLTGGPPPLPMSRPLAPWLAIVIAALWLAERWFATRRARGVAP